MRIRRDIASIPVRSASETWEAIVALITAKGSRHVEQLNKAGPTIASLITDELPAQAPFVLEGCGPQLRIYCSYGFKAIEAGTGIDALTFNPTEDDWTMHVPCDSANLNWVTNALKPTPRIKAFDVATDTRAAGDATTINNNISNNNSKDIVIDWTVKG